MGPLTCGAHMLHWHMSGDPSPHLPCASCFLCLFAVRENPVGSDGANALYLMWITRMTGERMRNESTELSTSICLPTLFSRFLLAYPSSPGSCFMVRLNRALHVVRYKSTIGWKMEGVVRCQQDARQQEPAIDLMEDEVCFGRKKNICAEEVHVRPPC